MNTTPTGSSTVRYTDKQKACGKRLVVCAWNAESRTKAAFHSCPWEEGTMRYYEWCTLWLLHHTLCRAFA